MMVKAFIAGCSSTSLTNEEQSFFASEQPVGLILFARNCREPDQIRELVASYREAVGDPEAFVLIDQEGGRVRRLRPPHWPDYPPGEVYARLYERDRDTGLRAAFLGAQLIGSDLAALGINVDCAPILDVRFAETDDVIGDRAYGSGSEQVASIGRAVADGLETAGVLSIIKHIPGHGRATADSHLELPVVDASHEALSSVDFAPFKALADLPMAMTAHIVYSALDAERCATLSPSIIENVIRQEIGFAGLLMSDDVSMKALGGPMRQRIEGLFAAGCDLALHCNGDFAEMQEVAAASPLLEGAALDRVRQARARLRAPAPIDRAALREEFDGLIAQNAIA
ncbi:beta-N-acetylhexosaminidase [Stappia sp. F7233]|uniref:beta-N-acetylhexosaminidase n=1 Tax=Stappia albiluteola TaxID=2758565 RepID=A0A839AC73_9HYPH|nr:beta-N-acetylhexosaminidase [Stappia albiluteola]MBA5776725.1 beta-N-acetylhexosaminidase [Stappia albiluteola]